MPISTHLPTCTKTSRNSTLETFQKCHLSRKLQEDSHSRGFLQETLMKKEKTKIGTYSRETIFQKTQAHYGCYGRDHNWAYESATQQQKRKKNQVRVNFNMLEKIRTE